ncbi:beta-ketoacyl-[acyl-carrier-protein] synthase family protein [Amycolatopsis sp. NPDC059090]|uniref:beta-ketoacyl-[acyl-carrier-protein] synthase family protein n=1 Tax=unclassified Amycolatopsis TaxID=2618356 RepID=UPI00366A6D22
MKRTVITGMGALTPVGRDVRTTWRALLEGRSGIGPVTLFDAADSPVRIAGEISGFDPGSLLRHKVSRRSARFSQLAVAAAREAVADARLEIGEGNADRVGVAINTAVAGIVPAEQNVRLLGARGARAVSPMFVPGMIPNMPACEVAIDLGVHGPVIAGSLACASGNHAVLEAGRLIREGEADIVLAGGTDAAISEVMFAGLSTMGALSRRNDEPEAASRPFDRDRDGFVYGEGAVVFVVESECHAAARGAVPYAEIAGGALTSDAFHVCAPEPSGRYAAEALRRCLRRSELEPADLGYVCAHGTSTLANDRIEARVLREVLGPAAGSVPVSSPKSMVGHMIAAAGALSVLVCALAMRDGVIPPTINLDTPDLECELEHVRGKPRVTAVRASVANAFGFGGQNCVVALRAV